MRDLFDDLPDRTFRFNKRPIAISGDLRPSWRISSVLLILKEVCRGNSASIQKLHLINWAINTPDTREAFRGLLAGSISPTDLVVRIEPALNRALHFAEAEGLIESRALTSGYRIVLTARGLDSAEHLARVPDCFVEEKRFLESIKGRVTESAISDLLSKGD